MAELPPRLRYLIGFTTRVVLVVLMFQIAALDHHFGVSDVVGVEGSSAHTMHCHGDASGCADSGSGAIIAVESLYALPREVTLPLALESLVLRPMAAPPQAEPEPPRL